jgi:hypothetical protein
MRSLTRLAGIALVAVALGLTAIGAAEAYVPPLH